MALTQCVAGCWINSYVGILFTGPLRSALAALAASRAPNPRTCCWPHFPAEMRPRARFWPAGMKEKKHPRRPRYYSAFLPETQPELSGWHLKETPAARAFFCKDSHKGEGGKGRAFFTVIVAMGL